MNYELAKQLNDADFVHKGANGTGHWDEYYDRPEKLYIPTLSELIEQVGNEFVGLYKDDSRWEAQGKYWCCQEHGEGRRFTEGATPEEAVARLWLALNKNETQIQDQTRDTRAG